MLGLLVLSRCGEGLALLSPSVLLSLSMLLRFPAALYGSYPALHPVPALGVPQKSADSAAPAFCAFPGPSSSGSQELHGRTLPG